MPVKVPSLTASGWLSEIGERADLLLAYYLTSEKSQSYVYYGSVTSLTYHVQRYGYDSSKLEQEVSRSLTDYFSRYFEDVDLDVTTQIPNSDDPERLNLRIDVLVSEKGERYRLGREIQVEKSTVKDIMKINNG